MTNQLTRVAVLTAVLALAYSAAVMATPTDESAQARTFAYRANGTLAGWVRREGARNWWASNGGNSMVYRDKRGGYGITEGFHTYWYAWPLSRPIRNRYVVWEGPGRPRRTNDSFVQVRATRWNVFRDRRLAGYTKGPDGVAAALGFYMWGDDLLPD